MISVCCILADKPASGLIDDERREYRFAVIRRRAGLAAEVDCAAADIGRAQLHSHADTVARIGSDTQTDLRRIIPILLRIQFLRHFGVLVDAGGCQDDALVRLDRDRLTVLNRFCADHLAIVCDQPGYFGFIFHDRAQALGNL